jgi:hypothetical protein
MEQRLADLRGMYEPYVRVRGALLLLPFRPGSGRVSRKIGRPAPGARSQVIVYGESQSQQAMRALSTERLCWLRRQDQFAVVRLVSGRRSEAPMLTVS